MDELTAAAAVMAMSVDDDAEQNLHTLVAAGTVSATNVLQQIDSNQG